MAVFSAEELAAVDDVRREPLEIWHGKTVWVWGLTFRQFLALHREAMRPDADGQLRFDPERYAVARVIECVRESAERDAKPVFSRAEHYEWIASRDAATVDRILRLSMRLSGEEHGDAADPPLCVG